MMESISLATSSDSEDDCYGGVVQKLQNLKNRYMEDKVENVLLLKPNTDIDDIIKQNASVLENHQTDSINPRRVTRKKKVNNKDDSNDGDISCNAEMSQIRGRGRRGRRVSVSNTTTRIEDLLSSISGRGNTTKQDCTPRRGVAASRRGTSASRRGASASRRGASASRRGASASRRTSPRRTRNRRNWRQRRGCDQESIDESYSIPVGDVDYPDQSKEQPLFSNPITTQPQEVLVENEILDPLSDNEELSVKVFWQNCDVFKFQIRRFQKLTQLFDFFSKRESLSYDKLLLTYNGRILKPSNTPDSIDYSIAKFIDGGVIKNSVTDLSINSPVKSNCDLITIKFQSQIRKHPLEIKVFLEEKFSVAFMKCAEQLDVGVERLKFYFDGDMINPQSTPRGFEFEDGECIDVKFVD
ncbi:Uncharacterized protein CG4449 [Eumeta japonica]|uniref:Uncharacterized protein CG4449 n=1 Tax=Eumeta variegata TaxID=151549 RepID=A0A4C1TWQ5_EUMVA|nr:Uncharacterized protein CG4449 [Eumeta japonica]